jgi:8-amino-7-oxononanoate synthase
MRDSGKLIFSELEAGLDQQRAASLLRRRRTLESPQTSRVTVDGQQYVAFCSNDYLGLANHPELITVAQEAVARWGVGAGASHLVLGHMGPHQAAEERLAAFVGLPRALLFSGGYMANLGVVTALAGRDDAVFADKLNHASLNDACLLARADFKRFPHNDLAALEKLLAASTAKRKLIAVDAVFSMDGDLAPVRELLALAERFDAWLYLDDAHGFGVLGAQGRGILSHAGLASDRIIYMATLGKAAGVAGAFVAAAPVVIDTLIQRARTYIYTTATPPAQAATVVKSLDLIARDDWRRERLQALIAQLKAGVPKALHLAPSDTAIQPLMVGDNARALALTASLAARGVLVPAIRPPTVPAGTARLRISLSAAHETADVAALLDALA